MNDSLFLETQNSEILELIEIDNILNEGENNDLLSEYHDMNIRKTLISDKKISDIENRVRKQILEKNIGVYKRSPVYKSAGKRDWDEATSFDYERSMAPDKLEEILTKQCKIQPKFVCAFRSGMAAITATFYTIVSFYMRNKEKKMLSYVSYFEINTLLDVFISSCSIDNKYISNEKNIYDSIMHEEMNLLFIELMDVSLKDAPVDIEKLKKALICRQSRDSLIVIIDTTLVDDRLDKANFLESLPNNIIIIFVQSCMKLKQLGFEFSNMGLIEVYTNSKVDLGDLKRTFKAYRALTGTTIEYVDECILVSSIFSNQRIYSYCSALRENVGKCYREIKENHRKEIDEINYQSNAPFFLIKLKEKSKRNYIDFIDRISSYLTKKEAEFFYGTSFGFRHTRMELIDHGNEEYSIRISPGRYWNKSTELLVMYLKGDY